MIRTLLISVALLTGVALFCGCEWTTGGNVDSWNESQTAAWADFSGSYKAADGGMLVRSFGDSTSTNQVTGEQIGTGDGSATAFSGLLAQKPVPGTLTIVVGAYRFTDSGAATNVSGTVNLAVTPADGAAGTFNYGTRVWTLTFPAPIASGSAILAAYFALVDISQGNHGKAIYSFIVYQLGNRIQIVDNNNGRYDGEIGNVRETGETSATGTRSGPVEAQFSATGTSQGYKVTIVGVLQGTINGQVFSGRIMNATFIEEAGSQADIKAVAQ